MKNTSQKINFVKVFEALQPCQSFIGIMDDYLSECFYDLSSQVQDENNITKLIFAGYIGLPVIVSNQIFKLFYVNGRGNLIEEDFKTGMKRLYFGTYETLTKFTFNLLDLDSKNEICPENVELLLSYLNNTNQLPLKVGITQLVIEFFNQRPCLTFTDYLQCIEKQNSTIFLLILILIYQKQPFTQADIKFYNLTINTSVQLKKDYLSLKDKKKMKFKKKKKYP